MTESGYGMLTKSKSTLNNKSGYSNTRVVWVSGIVALYLSIVVYMSIWDTLKYYFNFLILFAVIFYALFKFANWSDSLSLLPCKNSKTVSSIKFYVITFLIIFLGQMLYWFAFYPGGFNLDALGQWDQIHGYMQLNNWHPVFTTGCYWLLTRIYDNFAFCIFAQLLIFSVSVAYLLLSLYRLNISKSLLIAVAIYISLNPAIGMNNVCLFKDVPFTIALVWIITMVIKVIESKGTWLKSVYHLGCFIFNLVAITLIRHNGIFYIIPLLLCIAVLYRHDIKRILSIILTYVIVFMMIQCPLFTALSVEQHSNLTGEVVGIPMAIMANAFIVDYENTPDDVKEFLISIADNAEWNEKYELGEWDSCKWDFGGIDLFQGESIEKFIRLTLSTLISAPEAAYQSIRENTRVVWQILGFAEWDTWVYIEDNEYGISEGPNRLCSKIVDRILDFSMSLSGTFLCWNIGVPNALLMFLILLIVVRREYEKLTYCLPVVFYNLLTMLLLCGPSHRYFYFNSVLILPIALLLLREKEEQGKIL